MAIAIQLGIRDTSMILALPTPRYAGWYKLEAHKVDADGKIISSRIAADWFPNLITDAGLAAMAVYNLQGSLLACAKVGSGTATPAFTDTALQTFIAGTSTNQAGSSAVVVGPPRYAYYRVTKRFGAGQAAGNLTEIGMGRASTNTDVLYSRALIVDGAGNPTTITILADEVLDVTYELRRYYDIADIPYSGMVIAGVSYSGVIRPSNINDAQTWYGYANTGAAGVRAFGGAQIGNGGIGPNNISNPLPGATASSNGVNLAYVPGSLYRDYSVYFDLNQGNFGGITGIVVNDAYGDYQISVTPGIPKDATKVLTLVFRCGPWSRYP
jgi:hypothetical protein